jgi:two-component system NtrC family sensor kinase
MPSLQRKIQVGYYAFAGAVAGVALLAYSDLRYLERNIAPDVAASRLLDAVLEIRRYEKNWFLYGGAEALAEVEAYAEQAQGLIAAARPQLTELGGPGELERLDADLVAYRRLLAGVGEAPPNGDPAQEVRRAGRRLAERAERIAHARHTRLQDAIAHSRVTLLAAGALAIVLSVLAAQWLAGRATRPLGLLVEKLRDIAEGRYDQVAPVSQDREILAVSTAVNRMLAELEARHRHLVQAEKLASLGTLVSGVAHELNNPLSNVSSSCQILVEELATADQAQIREWLGQIDAETERARNIVRTLLDFSRDGDFRKRRLALRPLVEQTLVLVGRGATGASLSVEVPEGLTVDADPQRLQQVLVNLIGNALDAGGPGVRVTLSARVCDATTFKMPEHSVCGRSGVPAASGEHLVLITVEDSGPGIAPEVLPRVFDPFFTTKDVGHGSGLGLYVSQEIVDQHGGCIGVSSVLGAGTTFTIALPCADPSEAS